jgi:hypothetical protein
MHRSRYSHKTREDIINIIDPNGRDYPQLVWAFDFVLAHELMKYNHTMNGSFCYLSAKGIEKIESGGFGAEYKTTARVNFWVIIGGIAAVIAAITGIASLAIELLRK